MRCEGCGHHFEDSGEHIAYCREWAKWEQRTRVQRLGIERARAVGRDEVE